MWDGKCGMEMYSVDVAQKKTRDDINTWGDVTMRSEKKTSKRIEPKRKEHDIQNIRAHTK